MAAEDEVIVDLVINENGDIEKVNNMAKSISDLEKANEKLVKSRKDLDLTSEQGRMNAAKLTAEIDKNSATIKKGTTATGSWTDSFKTLMPGLSGAVSGINQVNAAAWKFVLNPIGAIIAAIVLVLATMYAAVQRTTGGLDKFEQITAALSAGLKVIIDRVARFGEGLIKLLSGDISGGLEQMENSFKGIGDEMEREIGAAYELQKAIQALEDAEINYEIAAKESANAIKELMLQSKNRLLTEQQRQDKLKEALKLEEDIHATEMANKKEAIRIALEQAELDRNSFETTKQKGESEYDYGKRLIASGELIDANRDKLKEALLAYQDSIGNSIALQEKLQNASDALFEKQQEKLAKAREKAKADAEKAAAERKKIEEQNAKDDEKRFDDLTKLGETTRELQIQMEKDFESRVKREIELEEFKLARLLEDGELNYIQRQIAEQEHTIAIMEINAKADEERLKMKEETAKKEKEIQDQLTEQAKKNAADQAKVEKFKNDAIIGGVDLVFKKKSIARMALNSIFKADAIKETVTNTYAAAIAAYKSLAGIPIVGPVLGAAAAAAVGIFGAAQVANIVGVQFARGGKVSKRGTFDGPSHAGGGTNWINERTGDRINVEGNENFYVLKKTASEEINRLSSLNVKHGGRSFGATPHWYNESGGQIATRSSSNDGLSQADIEGVVAATVKNMKLVVLVDDIASGLSNKATVEDRAQVFGN